MTHIRSAARHKNDQSKQSSKLILPLLITIILGAIYSLLIGDESTEAENIVKTLLDFNAIFFDNPAFPRTLMAILAGMALGVSGMLIQKVTRNPLASPATLGTNSGALFAVALATIILPDHVNQWLVTFAFIGATCVSIFVFFIARQINNSTTNIVLIGMITSTLLISASFTILIHFGGSLHRIYLWAIGNLALVTQNQVLSVFPFITFTILLAVFFSRAFFMLELGEQKAWNLGLSPTSLTLFAFLLAMLLSALVVGQVGILSFVGLLAPILTRSAGIRTAKPSVVISGIFGAILVLFSDILARKLSGNTMMIASGVILSIIGSTFLLIKLFTFKNKTGDLPESKASFAMPAIRLSATHAIQILILITLLSLFTGLSFGLKNPDYWNVIWPRVFIDALSGASLAVSGTILQTLFRNPLASPDIIGVTSSGTFFVLLTLYTTSVMTIKSQLFSSLIGSVLVIAILLHLFNKKRGSPTLLVLAGICISSITSTGLSIILTMTGESKYEYISWLSGTTYVFSKDMFYIMAIPLSVAIVYFIKNWRFMNLLQIGDDWPYILGQSSKTTFTLLLLTCSILSALSVSAVGGMAFIGLIVPHAVRMLNINCFKTLIPASALLGASLLVISDWIGRTVMYPYEIPSGNLISLIGSGYFIIYIFLGKYSTRKRQASI